MLNSKMCDFIKDQALEFKEALQLQNRANNNKILCTQCGDLLRALGQNYSSAKVLKVLMSPKSNEMNKKILDFEHLLPMLRTVAKNKG
ncbi:myosin light polypeptide 6 isoform X1 [Sigmodon hispidus]